MRRALPRRSRFVRYIRGLFKAAVILAAFGLILFFIQRSFGLFDREIAAIGSFLAAADTDLSNEAFAGISLGSLALVLGLCLLPVFVKKFDNKAYLRGLRRGLISALVFFVSNGLYSVAARASRLYLIGAIAIVVVVSALLVEGIALAVRETEERSFRTDIVASIASGLLFSVLLKLGQYGYEWLRSGMAKL
ncbi:MAG TPA: hypothetical protein VMV90_00760 [Rectinemataceae bacterium]|nr:hypothetical protein [Rectinemataceae bacterium]